MCAIMSVKMCRNFLKAAFGCLILCGMDVVSPPIVYSLCYGNLRNSSEDFKGVSA